MPSQVQPEVMADAPSHSGSQGSCVAELAPFFSSSSAAHVSNAPTPICTYGFRNGASRVARTGDALSLRASRLLESATHHTKGTSRLGTR